MKNQQENKSKEKMTIKLKDDTLNEILQKKEKRKNKQIITFNNKKNNLKCSDLLKTSINTEKELLFIPYAKEKQKKNKTLDELGRSNGISYPSFNVIKGILAKDDNYKVIIREDDLNKYDSKTHKFTLNTFKYNTAEINLDNKA